MASSGMVMGIETEYSICAGKASRYEHEGALARAARALCVEMRNAPEIMGGLLPMTMHHPCDSPTNVGSCAVMQHVSNGSRYYLDGTHPELSTAECQNPREVVLWDAAGERIMQTAADLANEQGGLEHPVTMYKKTMDGHGHTWGCHENYCITPQLFHALTIESKVVAEQRTVATWLVVRQLLTGAGRMLSDGDGPWCAFQISQRADHIMKFRNNDTMKNRPVIQQRNEPLANSDGWRRFHVICGDANLCQWSTYIKMSLTGLLLLLWQEVDPRQHPPLPIFDAEYPHIMKLISHESDLNAKYPVRMNRGRAKLGEDKMYMTAADILRRYTAALSEFAKARTWSSPEEATSYQESSERAHWAAQLLYEHRWRELYGWLDWPTKRIIIEEYLRRKGKTWSDINTDYDLRNRMKALGDYAYTTLNQKNSMIARLRRAGVIHDVVKSSHVARAILTPPPGRASQRGLLLEAYGMFCEFAEWQRVSLLQDEYRITVWLENPFGCPDVEFRAIVAGAKTPLDFTLAIGLSSLAGVRLEAKRR